jgi:hypothetical protein
VLVVEEAKGSVLEAQGELITTQYFDSLAAEVNELLQVGHTHSAFFVGYRGVCGLQQ